jgi:hypothetical protein
VNLIIGILPPVELSLPPGSLDVLSDVMYGMNYFLPMDFIIMIVMFSFSLDIANLVWKSIKTLKGFILGGD